MNKREIISSIKKKYKEFLGDCVSVTDVNKSDTAGCMYKKVCLKHLIHRSYWVNVNIRKKTFSIRVGQFKFNRKLTEWKDKRGLSAHPKAIWALVCDISRKVMDYESWVSDYQFYADLFVDASVESPKNRKLHAEQSRNANRIMRADIFGFKRSTSNVDMLESIIARADMFIEMFKGDVLSGGSGYKVFDQLKSKYQELVSPAVVQMLSN